MGPYISLKSAALPFPRAFFPLLSIGIGVSIGIGISIGISIGIGIGISIGIVSVLLSVVLVAVLVLILVSIPLKSMSCLDSVKLLQLDLNPNLVFTTAMSLLECKPQALVPPCR